MNRWLYREEVVEQNQLTAAEERAVFAVLRPLQGKGEAARYLESEVDEAIGRVRRGRPLSPPALFVAEEEDSRMSSGFATEPFERIAIGIERLIDVLVPKATELVGTEYIAVKLGKSKQWIGKMAERGLIPRNCIAPKVSGGRIWKFHRDKIDAWLAGQR